MQRHKRANLRLGAYWRYACNFKEDSTMHISGKVVLVACLAAMPIAASAASLGCKVKDIALDRLSHRVEGAVTHVSGRIVSNCAQSTGVHLRVSVFDKSGSVLAVQDLWPASVKNIPPRGIFPFSASIRGVPNVAKFSVEILETKVWPKS
jgi:hypothetical protein